jgi:DNA-binding phage protein
MEGAKSMITPTPSVSHHEREVEELAADPALAVEYMKVAMQSLSKPDERGAALLALRAIAEAFGGLSEIAAMAGVSRELLSQEGVAVADTPSGLPDIRQAS